MTNGYLHSYQSMGTVDGPGVRFVIFTQGCPLRCAYCHNPDTWKPEDYIIEASVEDVMQKVLRYRPYFGTEGGVTVTGGEALLQPDFVYELFKECHKQNPPIHTCLDTSGCIINDKVSKLLQETDMVLLDLKMTTEEDYKKYTGADLKTVLRFLDLLEARCIPTWIRHVVIPGFNGDSKDRNDLQKLIEGKKCIEKTEYLPFRKICREKYIQMGIEFPFECYDEWNGEPYSARPEKG